MPIAELSYDELKQLAKSHECGACHSGVTVAWVGGKYVLRCARDINHNTICNKKRYSESLEKEIYKSMTTQLAKMDEAKMIARVNQAKFPQQLTPADKNVLVRAALDYGLDPLMGELSIYQGKPFISIDGRIRKAHESGLFEGIESRPATQEERQARGTPDGNKLWRSEVFKKGCSRGFVGWGEVRAKEMTGNEHLPTVGWPDRMAEKRSQVMALRLAFYLPLPSFEDIGADEPEPAKAFIEVEAKEIKEEPAKVEVKAGTKQTAFPYTDSDFR